MASRKSERLMNLVICLLVARRYVPKAKLRELVEDYRSVTDEAFEKMFERDKDELRELGVPVEVGQTGGAYDPEVGYRIRRSAYELPPLSFTAEEAALLGLAARVWQHASMAEATSRAVVKLSADGLETDTSSLAVLEPKLPASEPAFEPLWQAVQRRRVVRFDYRRPGAAGPAQRTLEPWGILNWRGRWYVVGHDRDRAATRMFRLSRIIGKVETIGRPGAYQVPEDVDLRQEAARLAPPAPQRAAQILARVGAAGGLRRRARRVEPGGGAGAAGDGGKHTEAGTKADAGWDRLEIAYGDPIALTEEIATYGADVVVLDPPDLRELVIGHLKELVA